MNAGAVGVDVDPDRGPPMTVPLRHFVVALGFLLAAGAVGALAEAGMLSGQVTLASRHLLLVGWVCVTILGAMTQFVPVWSGVALHSRRLATAQLWLVTPGLASLVAGFLGAPPAAYAVAGVLLVAGFWTFVYNVARSLARVEGGFDVTERHFAAALGFFAVVPVLGALMAADYAVPFLADAGIPRTNLRAAHATLAVFGAVLTTVVGALYQLARMFTQTDEDALDRALRRTETALYPAGVVVLAAGRLAGARTVAVTGAVAALLGLAAFAVLFGRTLARSSVERTPMLRRYAVAVAALVAWLATTAGAWVADPLAAAHLLGADRLGAVFLVGVVAFVVLGTVYHVVPFIVWVHRYSDRLGLERVPMIDDLYDDRFARVDLALTVAGFLLLAGSRVTQVGPTATAAVAGRVALFAGFAVFAANVAGVLRAHAPYTFREMLFGDGTPE